MLVEAVPPLTQTSKKMGSAGYTEREETSHMKGIENTYIHTQTTYKEIHRKYKGEQQCTSETERTERKVAYGVSQV